MSARARGATRHGRDRAQRTIGLRRTSGKLLFRTVDHGDAITVRPHEVGAGKRSDRWVEPFLDANRPQLRRLALTPEIAFDGEVVLRLHPADRIGATPLLSASTRKVCAGLLVAPRFRWSALANVVGDIGYSIEPRIGGDRLVPGSAHDVPAWLIAGPVLRRLEALLRRTRRTFVEEREIRTSPRGRVDWGAYAQRSIATGRWHHLPCRYSSPVDDPKLLANIRWTIDRIAESLVLLAPTPVGRSLLTTAADIIAVTGDGPRLKPDATLPTPFGGDLLLQALEAMAWVADERGLGGARTLDGLAWDLAVDLLWESWVARVMRRVGPRCGFAVRTGKQTERHLRWHGPVRSMQALIPDIELTSGDRVAWVDAKYKAHLMVLARTSWRDLHDAVRESHRADLHQALAYASLANVTSVDTILAYPVSPDEEERGTHFSVATVASGRRRVRVMLAGLPFGFRSASHEERVAERWRAMLRAAA